jgi:hypothetical protein
MRTKYKIYYPKNHPDTSLAGTRYKPGKGKMVVMNEGGVFFLVEGLGDWYTYITKLSDVLPKYDVVFRGEQL